MTRCYRPERPSLWRDFRAIPFDLRGADVLLAPALVWVAAMIAHALA